MSNGRKRLRQDVPTDETRAECPFSVKLESGDDRDQRDQKKPKKRRRHDDNEPPKKICHQLSPFAPAGKFKTHETLDMYYSVDPSAKWHEMTRYNSFVLNGQKYFSEGFIFVANESTIERQRDLRSEVLLGKKQRKRSDDDWVARILEIRASDEHHVYARVYWMYWPDELPAGTTAGKKYVQGRQSYHGHNELIASNHMDIINVVSVTSLATVNHWVEENDEETQSALYWRQAFDFRTLELSTVEPVCRCGEPEHPDKTLVGCSNESCGKWLHDFCLIDDALMKTFEKLGHKKPHAPVKKEEDDGASKDRPLSPTETTVDETQPSIAVKAEGSASDAVDATARKAEELGSAVLDPLVEEKGKTNTPPGPNADHKRRKSYLHRTNGAATSKAAGKPYVGLFEASLKMDSSPPEIEIKDLRKGVAGGTKLWTESLACLICGSTIN